MSKPTIYLYTIGFTKKSAEEFFSLLSSNGVSVLVDSRLKPDSQLSGFAKQRDLPYFLKHLIQCDYRYLPDMAPSDEILKQYRSDKDWSRYEKSFNGLLEKRKLIALLKRDWWREQRACLLCSEHEPDFCHRRLVAEYMKSFWPDMDITHLM